MRRDWADIRDVRNPTWKIVMLNLIYMINYCCLRYPIRLCVWMSYANKMPTVIGYEYLFSIWTFYYSIPISSYSLSLSLHSQSLSHWYAFHFWVLCSLVWYENWMTFYFWDPTRKWSFCAKQRPIKANCNSFTQLLWFFLVWFLFVTRKNHSSKFYLGKIIGFKCNHINS